MSSSDEERRERVRGRRRRRRARRIRKAAIAIAALAIVGATTFVFAWPHVGSAVRARLPPPLLAILSPPPPYSDIVVGMDTDAGDWYGSSVALSGTRLAVGAFRDSDELERAGAVYIGSFRDGAWTNQSKLVPADRAAGDQTGFSVALDGDWLAVGAVGGFAKRAARTRTDGRVHVYRQTRAGWEAVTTLTRPSGQTDDRYGFSVSIDDGWLAVGARGVENKRGAVYLHALDALDAAPLELRAPDAAPGDRFGEALALAGGTLIVGAPGKDVGDQTVAGAAFVFARDGENTDARWRPLGPPLVASPPQARAQFAIAVDTDGENAIIGASHWAADGREGSVWVSARDATSGTWKTPEALPVVQSAPGDMDGFRVAIDGPDAVASAHLADSGGSDSGAVLMFRAEADGWRHVGRIAPADGRAGDNYGIALALDGQTLLVGAETADAAGADSGGVYIRPLAESEY